MEETALSVLGLGRMGMEHCRQICSTPGLTLTGASSRSRTYFSQAEEAYGIVTYESHEELIEHDPAPWVVICTYTHEHLKWASRVIEAGKHVILEKPAALNAAETEYIFESADKRGVKVTVHQNRRWDRDFQLVRKVLAEESMLGSVYRIESRSLYYSTDWAGWGAQGMDNPWRLKKEYGGGMLGDWGAHLFDQLLVLCESPIRTVFGRMESRIWTSEVDDHFWAELLFDDGTSARVEASNNHRLPLPRWYIIGTDGTLSGAGGDPEHWNQVTVSGTYGDFPQSVTFNTSQHEFSSGFYDSFSQSLLKGLPFEVTPKQVIRTMQCVDAVRKSHDEGVSVHLDV